VRCANGGVQVNFEVVVGMMGDEFENEGFPDFKIFALEESVGRDWESLRIWLFLTIQMRQKDIAFLWTLHLRNCLPKKKAEKLVR